MSKKWNIYSVRAEFEKRGYTLLSKRYVNNKEKLEYKCENGHINQVVWRHFKNKSQCPICYGLKLGNSNEEKIDFLKKEFLKRGYKLLTKNYKNNIQKLEYICPNGHKGEISWQNFQSGKGCKKCSNIKTSKRAKHNIGYIKKQFKDRGYKLLSKQYNGQNEKLEYICPKGHRGEISYRSFQQGSGCSQCGNERSNSAKRLGFEEIKSTFDEVGYTLLSNKYTNTSNRLLFICDKGHVNKISPSALKSGQRCATCMGRKIGDLTTEKFIILLNRTVNDKNFKKITDYLRSQNEYRIWQGESIKRYGRKCVISKDKDICIHHLEINFNKILSRCLQFIGINNPNIVNTDKYTDKHLKIFEDIFFKEHNKYLGIPISKKLHVDFHSIYGNKNNTLKQFKEFYKLKTGNEFKVKGEKKNVREL